MAQSTLRLRSRRALPGRSRGLTLLELMVVLAIVGILAAIALPSYQGYIQKSRAKTAAADLVGLAAAVEARFQRTLAYPTSNISGTAAVKAAFSQWSPAQGDFSHSYIAGNPWRLQATGSGNLSGCVLTLDGENQRTATAGCGFTSW
ncbi:type IV pilin protein [Halopseudomonas pertucinogena]|uniref:Type IV pilin n=1 Tax=Halopseudomonas pertucinogena TaxID=86175 RepID=A0ABQ2CPC6_9GAMM|nr:prepilin-type N-terminal cleavage/methylation domain-containing protein [Halopseudomonas pertucinogena]GGJ00279.1 type IV pilin [Halopseudomonas pertucinogena]